MRKRVLWLIALAGLALVLTGCRSYPYGYSQECRACVDPICRVNCAPDPARPDDRQSCEACVRSVLAQECAAICTQPVTILPDMSDFPDLTQFCTASAAVVMLLPGVLVWRYQRRTRDLPRD